jgi:hypothetical protein
MMARLLGAKWTPDWERRDRPVGIARDYTSVAMAPIAGYPDEYPGDAIDIHNALRTRETKKKHRLLATVDCGIVDPPELHNW